MRHGFDSFPGDVFTLVDMISGRFLYDGNRINEDDTPSSLDMEDNGKSTFSKRMPQIDPYRRYY